MKFKLPTYFYFPFCITDILGTKKIEIINVWCKSWFLNNINFPNINRKMKVSFQT